MLRLDGLTGADAERQTLGVARLARAAGHRSAAARALLEMLQQARGARSDARLLVRLGGREVRRYRGLLLLRTPTNNDRDAESFRWRGESEIALPAWGGVLRFAADRP